MMISTRGRYALRVMLDLAQQTTDRYVPLKEIANRQEISEKYLEIVIKVLVQNKLLTGLRGKGGGYRLTRAAWRIYSGGDTAPDRGKSGPCRLRRGILHRVLPARLLSVPAGMAGTG